MPVLAVRPAAVADMFYTGDPARLHQEMEQRINHAGSQTLGPPKALIVPHAGHIYSGDIAASAYALLKPLRKTIRRVVMLGPCHRVPVSGLAIPSASAFRTPLGDVSLDTDALNAALALPEVSINDAAHRDEHCLEVQLPFLQELLEDFSLAPFVVGQADADTVAAVLEKLWGGEETLIVISSDLSHYHPYDHARRLDQATADAIVQLEPLSHYDQACGAIPVNGLILAAHRHGLHPRLLDLRNSGDTAGDKSRVVGYGAFAFFPCDNAHENTDEALGAALLMNARNAIAARLGRATVTDPDHPGLAQPGATFVTLTEAGQLRGCIGSLEAYRPLGADVRANAEAAAFRDPRFAPVTADELDDIHVEVSLLAPPSPMSFAGEADALAQLRPGIDGLVLQWQGHRSTFLPQVWEQLPEPTLFLRQLKLKAGLPADFWAADVQLQRYEVKKWKENRM